MSLSKSSSSRPSNTKASDDLMRYYWLYPYKPIYRMICMNTDMGSMRNERVLGITYSGNSNVYEQKGDSNLLMYDIDAFKESIQRIKPESLHMDYITDNYMKNLKLYGEKKYKKEVVFDIDLTDFHRFCECGDKKQICSICWLHIEGSVLILSHFLLEVLQYNESNILWVFSGGKGVHCIVNNITSLDLSDSERVRLHKQVSISKEDDNAIKDFTEEKARDHPDFMKVLEKHFLENVVQKRKLLENPNFISFCVTRLISHFKAFTHALEKAWDNYDAGMITKKRKILNSMTVSESKWNILCELEKELRCPIKPSQFIIIRLFHPIIDLGPLRIKHKFKMPFSIHGTTGNVSLPVRKETLLTTDMVEHPLTLKKLLERRDPEMDRYADAAKILLEWVDRYNCY